MITGWLVVTICAVCMGAMAFVTVTCLRHGERMYQLGKSHGRREAGEQALTTGLYIQSLAQPEMGVLVKLEKVPPPPVN